MHSAQPLEILADELGAATGRIERELRLKDEARAARFEARLAAIELAAFKAEEERQRKFETRMAELRDGKDGEPGKDGNDADIQPLWDAFNTREINIGSAFVDLEEKINERLAQVRDGKDGEPGRDGKDGADADTRLILMTLDEQLDGKFSALERVVYNRLAEVKDGKDGEAGKAGPSGKDGQDGKMPIAREWTNRVHYAGDVVRHNGSTYQALEDTGREPPHGDWGELAGRGTDGRGFALRGRYDATIEYRQHDLVMINRNSFAAKYDSPGECPGDGWQLFACSGYKGKEGPPGQAGPKGADGRSVSIVKWEANPDEMALVIADSAGNTFTIDLQPIAERIVEAAR